ncbi:MAG: citrate/2-methylcitrate synthase [Bacteriovoracaceae bacterium]|nr:citrate/2-methylcitrate synthase [Bacteriovoracaceae bacterium]
MLETIETVNTGLNKIPVCKSAVSATTVDDESNPILMYKNYSIYDLVQDSFEESVYLLLNSTLPNKAQLKVFNEELKSKRQLPPEVVDHIMTYPKNVHRMDYLMTTLSYARMFDEDYYNPIWKDSKAKPEELASLTKKVAISMGAKIPTIIAYGERIFNDLATIAPDDNLSGSRNFLHMMGKDVSDEEAKALDTTLTLYLDHTLNNSTFLARVAESSRTDPYGPFIAASVGLKGVLHGGANEMARQMFDEIGSPDNTEKYVLDKLNRGGVIFGFGHRLSHYKTGVESRVKIAEDVARRLTKKNGRGDLMEIYDRLKAVMMSENIPERKRRAPNLDLPVAVIYSALNIPTEWNTPIFQSSRHFGWVAHMIEQRLSKGPLYRPSQIAINGKFENLKKYRPLSDRLIK